MEKSSWEKAPNGNYVLCANCDLSIPISIAKKKGCPKCNALPFQDIEDPNKFSTRKELLKSPKIPDFKEFSSKKLLGVYNIGEKYPNSSTALPIIPPQPLNSIRFVCLSDTHEKTKFMNEIPNGDVLLHSGDFSMSGDPKCVEEFNEFLGNLPHKHKFIIAGNHDITFEPDYYEKNWRKVHLKKSPIYGENVKKLFTKVTYLQDELLEIEGIKIYASPWQSEFQNWAFGLNEEESEKIWKRIPKGIDILLTHGPPKGHGGFLNSGFDVGCPFLMENIKRTKPIVHVFGHIHEGYGKSEDQTTTFINASICNYHYTPVNLPIVFDISK